MQRLWRLLPAPAEPQLGADVYSPLKQLSHRRLESNANVTRILTMNSNTNYGVTLLHNSGLNAVDSLVLADSLNLLAEVSGYLKRMPAVPATVQLVRDIDKYLEDPKTIVAKRLALACEQEMDLRQQFRTAATFTPAGVPVLKVQVVGDTVSLKLGDGYNNPSEAPQRQRLVSLAVRQLSQGIALDLKVPPVST